MSIGAQTAAAMARALAIGVVALAGSGPLSAWLAARPGRTRTLAWGLLLAPMFTPSLLISYAFAKFALVLVAAPWIREALYVGILALKLIPVAVIIRVLLPPPLSAEARHLHRMLAGTSWMQRANFVARGAGPGPWIAGGVVFLLAFSDFELASLWSIRTWTVAIFDAQTGGLAIGETLRLALPPLAVELLLLALIFRSAVRVPSEGRAPARPGQPSLASSARTSWCYLTASAALVCLLPLTIVATQAVAGIRTLAGNFILARELGASALFALGAALSAGTLARLGRGRLTSAFLLGAPGLLGALVISLVVLVLFQTPLLRPAYDTPLPLLLALILLLLPLALLLDALHASPSPALHLARQFGSRRLLWEMETRPTLTSLGLLFCFAWFDFTTSSILAPVGLTPVFARLHNLAHYGQTAVLSAMMLAAFAVPGLFLILVGIAARVVVGQREGTFRS